MHPTRPHDVEPSPPGRGGWRAPRWAALAACLAAGLIAGFAAGRAARPPEGPIVARDGALMARGAVARALDRQLALDGGAVRIGISFRDAQGRWCRTFQSTPDRLAGLACREPKGWRVRALAAWSPQAPAGLRTAASETPEAVSAAVDQTLAGTPADQAGERAARERGWRP